MINKLDKEDTMFMVLSVLVPVVTWWFLSGRSKYSSKGMK